MKSPQRRMLQIALLLIVIAAPTRADSQSVAEFYRGKTINLVLGVGVGGENDIVGRSVARYLSRHIPGKPSIVVQNMTGAGGIRAANYLYALAPQDGTYLGIIQTSLLAAQAVGLAGVKFDAAKFRWLGAVAPVVGTIVIWHTAGINTIEDARKREVVVAASGRGTATYTVPAMMNEVLGTKFKIVTGYPGGNEMFLAMERGEVEGRYATWSSLKIARPVWLKDKKIVVIARDGPRIPNLEAPSIEDEAKTADERQVIELILSGSHLGRPFTATPGVPEDRVSALRAAFEATMSDQDFIAESRRLNLDVAPIGGESLQTIVNRVLKTPKELAARAKRLLE